MNTCARFEELDRIDDKTAFVVKNGHRREVVIGSRTGLLGRAVELQLLFTYTQYDLFRLAHAMPYMITYYQSGLLVTFRCTDCEWTYTVQNPCSDPIPRQEEEKAKKQYVTHRCSECSSKTTKK